jgi:hypothetical protein
MPENDSPSTVALVAMFGFIGATMLGTTTAVVFDRPFDGLLPLTVSRVALGVVAVTAVVVLARAVRAVRKLRKKPDGPGRHRKAVKRVVTLIMTACLGVPIVAQFATKTEALGMLGIGAGLLAVGLALAAATRAAGASSSTGRPV